MFFLNDQRCCKNFWRFAEINATNSRSMLAHMNQLRYNIEYHLAMAETVESTNWDYIEDIHFDYLFKRDKKYIKPADVLDKMMEL